MLAKFVPARMIALMFGMWYLAIAIGNKFAAVLGGKLKILQTNIRYLRFSLFLLLFLLWQVLLIVAIKSGA